MTDMLSDCAPSPWGDTTAILIAAPPAAEPGSTCEHCQQPFQQHRGKRFCSSKCRVAFHNANRKTSQAPQMSQASQVETPKRLTETLTETPKRLIGLPPDHDETSAPKVADEFDWGDPGGLMCEEQQAVVAYRNDNRDLVLRQKANWPHDQDDAVIIIAKGNIETFVDRLTDLLGFVGPA